MKNLLLVALLYLPVSGIAAGDPVTTPEAFLATASQQGMTGVALSNLALKKSGSPQVQEFARGALTLRSQAIAELAQIARARGIETPASLDSTHAALVLAVDTEEGASFDHVYAKHMKADHARTMALFEAASRSDDAEVAQFARKVLPSLKAQQAKVRKLARAAR